MKTKATIRTKALTESAVNGSNIRQRAKMTQDDYGLLFLDTGCAFIEHLFDLPGYEDMMDFYLRDTASRYWKWWRAEWMNHERYVYREVQDCWRKDSSETIKNLFKEMITSNLVHKSFMNHVKNLI
jgi:hypothetical protein